MASFESTVGRSRQDRIHKDFCRLLWNIVTVISCFCTAALPISLFVWKPIIDELTSFRQTQCQLTSMASVQASFYYSATVYDSCVTSCLAAFVTYIDDDDGSSRRAMIYWDVNQLDGSDSVVDAGGYARNVGSIKETMQKY